jgi:AcrR family transcriptional regulator
MTQLQKKRPIVPQPTDAKETVHDARVERSKEVILKITSELLAENGLGGVSVDEVSRRSGIAKTTIYRHWATRSDLLLDACALLSAEQVPPNTGSLGSDLRVLLSELANLLATARWASVLPSVMDAAERETPVAEVYGRMQMEHAAPFREVIQRAIERGELPPDSDPSILTATLVGPLYYRRWFSREPISDAFLEKILENALHELV